MSSESPPPYKSSIADLSLPKEGFKSNLPPHLLEGCDEQTKWLLNEVSKNTAMTEFAIHAVIEQNSHLKMLNGKTFKNEKGLAEAREKLDSLDNKATVMEPLFKPLSQFMGLWEYKMFRWGVYIVAFFLLTYVLPYYLTHPISLPGLWTLLFGT